ncbi:hypothetical protein CLV97_11393 [Planifilum fimeticola]|uniref:Uncharacterized protein n=2 Tax=Planifilum fimeticola TaxID=201975 RepID=A0A2T0LEI0_9BACL|nr:hypothetical protein CLV97_11393 [Planifilum fimeticola]
MNTAVWTDWDSTWIYSLVIDDPDTLNNPKARRQWISDVVQSLLHILEPFATPREVEVSTLSQGEEAFVIRRDDPEYSSKLIQYLSRTDDVTDVDFILTLHCYEVDENLNGKEIEFEIGGAIYLVIELDKDRNIRPSSKGKDDSPIWMSIHLYVDIHAPLLRKTKKSEETARINAPLLKNFLKRLESHLPVELSEVDAAPYLLEYLESI